MLAAFPNVAVKMSDFGSTDPQWDAKSIDPIVSEVISAFGIERCMLASNYPVERLWKPYAEIWASYLDYFSDFSEEEQEAIFWKNAARFYRIPLDSRVAAPAAG